MIRVSRNTWDKEKSSEKRNDTKRLLVSEVGICAEDRWYSMENSKCRKVLYKKCREEGQEILTEKSKELVINFKKISIEACLKII